MKNLVYFSYSPFPDISCLKWQYAVNLKKLNTEIVFVSSEKWIKEGTKTSAPF